jgi:hypothetical protein
VGGGLSRLPEGFRWLVRFHSHGDVHSWDRVFSLSIVRMLLLARRLCDALRLVSPLRGGTRSRAVVTLAL